MVKSYSRFEPDAAFGVISSNCNAFWIPSSSSSTSAGRAVVGALESLMIWDLKKGERIAKLNELDIKTEITAIAKHGEDIVAAGYSDGVIRVWDLKTETIVVTFNGHKSAISVLKFDSEGIRLASGSRDSNIIVWDIISEVGLYRLRSHKDQITGIEFIISNQPTKAESNNDDSNQQEFIESEEGNREDFIISTSKDGLVKLWDIATQYCMETHIAHRDECWALSVHADNRTVMTAASDGEIKVWRLDINNPEDGNKLHLEGIIVRQNRERPVTLIFHPLAPFFAVHGTDRSVEVYRIRSKAEVKKSINRKRSRMKEKLQAKGDYGESELKVFNEDDVNEIYSLFVIIRTPSRVRSIDWALTEAGLEKRGSLNLLVSLSSNSLELYNIHVPEKIKKSSGPPEYNKVYSLDIPGHRSDIRSLSISSDDAMLASASNGLLKIWNVKTTNCIRTFECGYALCSTFLPGDSIILVGTKTGQIEMFDVASSSLLDTIDAHDGSLWSMQVMHDGKGLVTGSADKSVKFWSFKIIQEEIPGTLRTIPRMKLKHTRTLELTDDVLSVRLSPDGKYVAASLLDSTIKVFFIDTLKFFLSLYGHKLPVLSMDISYDSKLLVSCSADKNIKIWGLDFGDCHRSIFAHDDSIMSIAFEPGSHNFFSVSKDKLVKYWDGDKFENIQKLQGHLSEIWALAVAHSGDYIVSASHDRSIRIWQQTDDQVFLEEEREREMEELYETNLAKSLDDNSGLDNEGDDQEVTSASGKQTVETLVAGERITEALDIAIADLEIVEEHSKVKRRNPNAAPPQRHAVFAALDNISAERYVLGVIQKVPPSQLQDALLLLPFDKILSLLQFVNIWAKKEWNIAMTSRVLFFLIRTYYKQIIANEIMRTMLDSVRSNLRLAIQRQKDELGFNIEGLKYVNRLYQDTHTKEFLDEEEHRLEEEKHQKKRAFITVN
ncbi:hypothetical protein V1511DRAFT_227805 [Dipodascopsis uninucleata]